MAHPVHINPMDLVTAGHVLVVQIFSIAFTLAKLWYTRGRSSELLKKVLANQVDMLKNQLEIIRLCLWLYEAHNLKDLDGTFMWMVRKSTKETLDKVMALLLEMDKAMARSAPEVRRELTDIVTELKEINRKIERMEG